MTDIPEDDAAFFECAVPQNRAHAAEAFVQAQGWGAASRIMVSGDWSGRSYIRLIDDVFDPPAHIMFMDWPCPPTELTRFITVRDVLDDLGLSVPQIVARDLDHGFMLLDDFGDDSFGRLIDRGDARTAGLYHVANDVLVRVWQHFTPVMARGMPVYDAALFATQAGLFASHYLPALSGISGSGVTYGPAVTDDFVDMFAKLLKKSLFEVPQTLILRDYTPDNIMLIPGCGDRLSLLDCGILDFQDAGVGPVIYDLVSLIEDARRDTPSAIDVSVLRQDYLKALPGWNQTMFDEVYAVLACQRLIRIIGVIGRQMLEAGNQRNTHMLPRLWRRLEGHLNMPVVGQLRAWLDRYVPPAVRAYAGGQG